MIYIICIHVYIQVYILYTCSHPKLTDMCFILEQNFLSQSNVAWRFSDAFRGVRVLLLLSALVLEIGGLYSSSV